MKRRWTGNLSLKLLSLVMAFLIWILIENINNPMGSRLIRDVQIQVINGESVTEIDKVYDIVSEDSVTLRVTERKSVRDSLSQSDFTVIADMENLNEMNTVPLTVTCSNPAVSWDEIEVVPPSMKVQLEQRKQSEFVVNVSVAGKPETGFEVGRTEIVQGKTIQIAGPESMLDRIGQVVAPINVTRISSDQRLSSVLNIYDKNGDLMPTSRLQVKDSTGVLLAENTVMVDVFLWKVKYDIPVEVEVTGTPAEGYRFAGVSMVPSTVSIVGTQDALETIGNSITLKNRISIEGATESFMEDIDITDTIGDNSELRLISEAEPVISVSVQIEQTGDHTLRIPLSNLEVLDRPEDLALSFSPADQIQIQVHSDDPTSSIGISDIKASIDLGVCEEADTYEIPVLIELPEGYTLVSDPVLVVTAEQMEATLENSEEQNAGE